MLIFLDNIIGWLVFYIRPYDMYLIQLIGRTRNVVFEKGGSYIENTSSGEWIPLEEKNGNYILRLWIHKNQAHPFGRQAQ